MIPATAVVLVPLLIVSLATVTSPHAQQYREDVPAVLTPEVRPVTPRIDDGQLINGFGQSYQRQRSPRIAIFWNRAFSDQLSQWSASERIVTTTRGAVAGTLLDKKVDLTGGDLTATMNEGRLPDNPRQQMNELAAAEFESAFMSPFFNAGTKLVDRSAVMRLTRHQERSQAGSDQVADSIAVETAALVGYADLLTEILMINSLGAPSGVRFRVSLKDVKTGQVVVSFVTAAKPPQQISKREWVATSEGFSEKPPTPPGAADVGRQLALETMNALTQLWR